MHFYMFRPKTLHTQKRSNKTEPRESETNGRRVGRDRCLLLDLRRHATSERQCSDVDGRIRVSPVRLTDKKKYFARLLTDTCKLFDVIIGLEWPLKRYKVMNQRTPAN
ncbi:unnamed protein product, partial [Brenthis ino]